MNNLEQAIPEQIEILECENKNLIVSASAGSGKTTIMIKKIFNYLLNQKCHIEDLLVLTYTKAAAQEMKNRLIDKIKDNIESHPHLKDELDSAQYADVSTFDSFCQKLIKKYFYVLNINPAFTILEGGDKEYQQGIAMEQAIEELQRKSPSDYELLLENFSPTRDDKNIKNLIFKIYIYSTSLLNIEELHKKTSNLYQKDLKIAENYLNNYYFLFFNKIKDELNDIIITCKNLEFKTYVEYINNLLSIIDIVLSNKNFTDKVDLINNVDYKICRKDNKDEIALKEKITYYKDLVKKTIDSIKEKFKNSETIINSYDYCNGIINSIFKLLNLFIQEYDKLKNKLGCFDFNDVERLTIKLLENDTICEEIKATYKYIFVDEFQDANQVQERIIFLLQNKNLFFVGDTKQSIYAFRQSDPQIFIDIQNKFSNNTDSSAKKLNCNFRTNKNILHFINKIFSIIMTEKTASINYKKDALFTPKAKYEDLENEVCVSVNLLNNEDKTDNLTPTSVYDIKTAPKIQDEEHTKNQCYFICQQILSLLNTNIFDAKTQTVKKVGFNDFAILLSKRGNFAKELACTFDEIGIPYLISLTDNLEETYDNLVLYNLLKYTFNQNDDYALYSILTSCLFNFTDNELAQIKLANKDCEYFYNCFKYYPEHMEDNISKKIQNFNTEINHFKFDCKYKGIFYALNKIIVNTNYLLNISFEDNFSSRKINIEQFINSFSNSKYNFNLAEYIVYREKSLRENKLEQPCTNSQAVQITTMHSSKGLEYPIVILPNLQYDITKSKIETTEIKINKEYGIGVKAYNKTNRTVSNGIFYECCNLRQKELDKSERIRLLYVATTRAKNKLILIGNNSRNYKKFRSDYDILNCNNYLSMIINSLDDNIIENINNYEELSSVLFDNEKIRLNVINYTADHSVNEIKKTISKQNNENQYNKLAEFLQQDLTRLQSTIALKNSVSSLIKDENSNITYIPTTLNINEHLTEKASDVGTLYHKVLETINFNNVNSQNDVKLFIECNFNDNEINTLKNLSYKNIHDNILILKSFTENSSNVLKEQKFVMRVPYNKIIESNIEDKILIQGIIDLLIIKNNEIILIDYKLSKKTDDEIKDTYKKQLDIYSLALREKFKDYSIKKYILNLYKNTIIEL